MSLLCFYGSPEGHLTRVFLYVVEQKQVLSLINLNVLIYENMKQIIVALCHKHTRENNLNQINKHSDFVPLGFRSFIR